MEIFVLKTATFITFYLGSEYDQTNGKKVKK